MLALLFVAPSPYLILYSYDQIAGRLVLRLTIWPLAIISWPVTTPNIHSLRISLSAVSDGSKIYVPLSALIVCSIHGVIIRDSPHQL